MKTSLRTRSGRLRATRRPTFPSSLQRAVPVSSSRSCALSELPRLAARDPTQHVAGWLEPAHDDSVIPSPRSEFPTPGGPDPDPRASEHSTPAEEIHASVREAMGEVGIDLFQEFPKPLTDEFAKAADIVVTMGWGEAFPVYPGKRYLVWELPDPAGWLLEERRPACIARNAEVARVPFGDDE